MLDVLKHFFSTACTPVLVGAGRGRLCNLWHRCSVLGKGKMMLNNANKQFPQPHFQSPMKYFHFRLCWSGEASSRSSVVRRRMKGIVVHADVDGCFCSLWNEAPRSLTCARLQDRGGQTDEWRSASSKQRHAGERGHEVDSAVFTSPPVRQGSRRRYRDAPANQRRRRRYMAQLDSKTCIQFLKHEGHLYIGCNCTTSIIFVYYIYLA